MPSARRTELGAAPTGIAVREEALGRAREFSPFLREAAASLPGLVDQFLEKGSTAAIDAALAASAPTVDAELRRRRLGVALAVALGDLAGELGFEEATRYLSDFADAAIEQSLATALTERVPDAEVRGITVLALGKLGSRELN